MVDKVWKSKVVVVVTDKGRFKATSPSGVTGFGRNKDSAIRACFREEFNVNSQ